MDREIREPPFFLDLPDLPVNSDGGLKRAAASCGNRCDWPGLNAPPMNGASHVSSALMRVLMGVGRGGHVARAPLDGPRQTKVGIRAHGLYEFGGLRILLKVKRLLGALLQTVAPPPSLLPL